MKFERDKTIPELKRKKVSLQNGTNRFLVKEDKVEETCSQVFAGVAAMIRQKMLPKSFAGLKLITVPSFQRDTHNDGKRKLKICAVAQQRFPLCTLFLVSRNKNPNCSFLLSWHEIPKCTSGEREDSEESRIQEMS